MFQDIFSNGIIRLYHISITEPSLMNRIGLTKRAGNAKLNLDAVQLTEVELPTGSTVIEADRLGIALDTCGLFLYQDIDHKGDCKK